MPNATVQLSFEPEYQARPTAGSQLHLLHILAAYLMACQEVIGWYEKPRQGPCISVGVLLPEDTYEYAA